ncbi:integrase [Paramagnetospirillum marisnigri]|uniref:Integrase n=1 Tax=Paramagnetospirillum marisnigri TaxID=1285242 RepID=A0A178MT39_9PROT|nr:site-specific integrase [Paramagnetospirillum marisnigri]OAN52991.1 integrase [Paramagnetospirillum marisnigri]
MAAGKLTALQVSKMKEAGRYADGGGLYLQVSKVGTKSWLFRFMLDGKAREMGLGSVDTVPLANAREEAEQCRRQLRDRKDPIEERKARQLEAALDAAKAMTFRQCAEAYIDAHKTGWKNAKHKAQWGSTLETYVYPVFGSLAVKSVDTGLVLKVLEPIWQTKTETASRVRGRVESILDWATARGLRRGENPARWRGHLDKLLPPRSKVQKVQHHAALPYEEMGAFMKALRAQDSVGARGLEFQILTAARPGEAYGAKWSEIDADKKVWTIPGERMKAGREHRVPLSSAAMAIIEAMKTIKVSDYVFPGMKDNRPLSGMAFLQLLKRMNRGDLTAHGFRSTFRDWCAEQTAYPRDVEEMALAHTIGNKVEAAYRRGDLFEKRTRLMQDWGNFCAMPVKKGNVHPIKKAK